MLLINGMLHKGTALILLWLMTAVVAVSQPGLRYCLCSEEITLGDCGCHVPEIEEDCHCCPFSQEEDERSETGAEFCADCLIDLQVHLTGHLSAASSLALEGSAFQVLSPFFGRLELPARIASSAKGIRGSPPSGRTFFPSGVPLYLGFSRFLL